MKKRVRVTVCGRVQGVGFRPTVYRYASRLSLAGFVRNTPSGVVVEVEGPRDALNDLVLRLQAHPPLQARIEDIQSEDIPVLEESGFRIVPSEGSGDLTVGMPPDLATCSDCLEELFREDDRRFRYPFINCTNCGPRFTIIQSLPYDREKTSMQSFTMCDACLSEYLDPTHRRFDAQPNACPDCGPSLQLVNGEGQGIAGDAIQEAAEKIRKGGILAVKGLGGYHLCCDAISDETVEKLRHRKARPHKSLAVMFKSLEQIEEYCVVDQVERQALLGAARPIVVIRRKEDSTLSQGLSPDSGDIGAFLPYTPLHHLLLSEVSPLIMTSGNAADEPIARTEQELSSLLGSVADYALVHDRGIVRRCDDSVLKIVGGQSLLLRRSRGLVPDTIMLPLSGPSVLGCGAELKNTFCVTRGATAFVSQHIGDLTDYRNTAFFTDAVKDLCRLLEVEPEIVAHDLHPDYTTTRYAESLEGRQRTAVQHHHAHMASVMAEHGLQAKALGVILDGAGYGPDGTAWGGEFLLGDLREYARVAHFKAYPMPGADAATLHPERMALSYLLEDTENRDLPETLLPGIDAVTRQQLCRMIDEGVRSPFTSSAGRLFDAVSALLGFRGKISYEGQAAIQLQAMATVETGRAYDFEIVDGVLDFGKMICALVADLIEGIPKAEISARFHRTVANGVVAVCEGVRLQRQVGEVVLSGGVFQNELLLLGVTDGLRNSGFKVYTHRFLPPNDACIGLGQVAVALAGGGVSSA